MTAPATDEALYAQWRPMLCTRPGCGYVEQNAADPESDKGLKHCGRRMRRMRASEYRALLAKEAGK